MNVHYVHYYKHANLISIVATLEYLTVICLYFLTCFLIGFRTSSQRTGDEITQLTAAVIKKENEKTTYVKENFTMQHNKF